MGFRAVHYSKKFCIILGVLKLYLAMWGTMVTRWTSLLSFIMGCVEQNTNFFYTTIEAFDGIADRGIGTILKEKFKDKINDKGTFQILIPHWSWIAILGTLPLQEMFGFGSWFGVADLGEEGIVGHIMLCFGGVFEILSASMDVIAAVVFDEYEYQGASKNRRTHAIGMIAFGALFHCLAMMCVVACLAMFASGSTAAFPFMSIFISTGIPMPAGGFFMMTLVFFYEMVLLAHSGFIKDKRGEAAREEAKADREWQETIDRMRKYAEMAEGDSSDSD